MKTSSQLTADQVVAWLTQVRDQPVSTPEARELADAALKLLPRTRAAREKLQWQLVDHSIIDTGLVRFRLESRVMAEGLVEAHNGVISGLLGVS